MSICFINNNTNYTFPDMLSGVKKKNSFVQKATSVHPKDNKGLFQFCAEVWPEN